MSRFLSSLLLVLGGLSSVTFAADDEALLKELKAITEAHFKSTNEEVLDAVMATVHSQAPSFLLTRDTINELLQTYDLELSLVDFKLVGRDDTYVVARVKQKSEKINGPAFKNNIVDAMWIFREEEGKWKLWSTGILEIKFLEEEEEE